MNLALVQGLRAKSWRRVLPWLAPGFFLALFFFYPLGSILWLGLHSALPGGAIGAMIAPTIRIFLFTVYQALLSTLLTLAVGLPAAFLFATYAFRGKTAQGTVTAVSTGNGAVTATVAIAKLPRGVTAKYTGIAQIQVKVLASDVLIVPTAAIKGSGSSATVQLLQNGKTSTKSVVVGQKTQTEAEITSGLSAGQNVVYTRTFRGRFPGAPGSQYGGQGGSFQNGQGGYGQGGYGQGGGSFQNGGQAGGQYAPPAGGSTGSQ